MTLPEELYAELDRRLTPGDALRLARYPGEWPERQPVHTCYVPVDHVVPELASTWGSAALDALDEHGLPDLGLDPGLVEEVLPRVRWKLDTEPIEDLGVAAEAGSRRSAAHEDDAVLRAAATVAADVAAGVAPPSVGIRGKSLEASTRHRGVRSLDLFLGQLRGGRAVVTLPKVTDAEQVRAFLPVLDALQAAHQVTLDLELQIETPQAVIGPDGTATLARMVHLAGPRLIGLHYGTYDYSAALGIAAAQQASDHPAADFAKQVMQVAVAGTRAHAVGGSTNVLPVGSRDEVPPAWQLHAGLVRRALERGFYQGWDLHPAQLVTRYVATYAFFRAALPAAGARLSASLDRADAGVLDEPATARALAGVVLRGVDCGAVDETQVTTSMGVPMVEVVKLARRWPRGD